MSSGTESAELDLRFDAGSEAAAAPSCSACSGAIAGQYYEAGGAVVCPGCRTAIEARGSQGSAGGRFGRAVACGLAGAVAGAALYYAILALTGYELSLVAIAVGWLVGRGVQLGSRERGGLAYQVLAVILTYVAIVSTYIPFILESASETAATPAMVVMMFVVALSVPFLAGLENILGLVIIGIGLWQAWRMNARAEIVFTGPYAVGAPAAPATADA